MSSYAKPFSKNLFVVRFGNGVVNVASFITGIITERLRNFQETVYVADVWRLCAIGADVFEREGKAGLASYLERVEAASRINAVFFDDLGNEVSGRPRPKEPQMQLVE